MALHTAVSIACGLLAGLPALVSAGTVSLPSYPLAVKNPYLSTWLPGNEIWDAPTAQPQFWAGQEITWTILARVNGVTYSLFGAPDGIDNDNTNVVAANTTTVSYSASHTIIGLVAGEASLTLDFFSPVFPEARDYARQSLPYSYLTVSASTSPAAKSVDVDVQVLSAIDQTWTAQDGASQLRYSTSQNTGYFWFYNPEQVLFTEKSDMATYGTVVFATTTTGKGVSHGCDTKENIYGEFARRGSLSASSSCAATDLAALSRDLGGVHGKARKSVTFAVGLDREHAINYLGETQTGFYRTRWPTVPEALEFFFRDYEDALATSLAFDAEVRRRSETVSGSFGPLYADIVEASVRQSFGALELTTPADNLAASTPSAFLKEISSDGNVNTVDLIFQSWPIFISLNPEYIRLLFQPILSYLSLPASEGWPRPWVIHDIGSRHSNGQAESMPLFETSTLFILLYAYQKFTGDVAWVHEYASLLDTYAEYLAANSLYPSSQLISVDAIPATANQTGLAVQATIGLKAASLLTGNRTLATLADSFARTIYAEALGLDGATVQQSTHFTYNYGKEETWNVLFASFSDVVLGLDVFPSAAWEMQSTWYEAQIQQEGLAFAGPETYLGYTGVAIQWGLTDWNVVAASVSSKAVQDAVVRSTHAFLTNGLNSVPFGTKYYVQGPNVGRWIANKARGTVGSHFALVALDQGVWYV